MGVVVVVVVVDNAKLSRFIPGKDLIPIVQEAGNSNVSCIWRTDAQNQNLTLWYCFQLVVRLKLYLAKGTWLVAEDV